MAADYYYLTSSLAADFNISYRSRASGWLSAISASGMLSPSLPSQVRYDYYNNADGGGLFTIDRIYYRFDLADLPINSSDIQSVKLLLNTDDEGQQISDANYAYSKIIQATNTTTSGLSGDDDDVWASADFRMSHSADYVTHNITEGQWNTFDFGSEGDLLFDLVVNQQTESAKVAFFHVTKLEIEGTAPTGTNRFNYDGAGGLVVIGTPENPPKLQIVHKAQRIKNIPVKVNGSLKIKGGNFKVKGGKFQ